jgi:hypothetical protein
MVLPRSSLPWHEVGSIRPLGIDLIANELNQPMSQRTVAKFRMGCYLDEANSLRDFVK